MIRVFDASAFAAIDVDARNPMRIFDALGDFVENGALTYCDEVVDELDRIAGGSYAYRWARAMKRARCDSGAAIEYYQRVLDDARELLDDGVVGESAPVQVLAQALALIDLGEEASVVTDDLIDKPTRSALSSACTRLNVTWIIPRACLADWGVEELLAAS